MTLIGPRCGFEQFTVSGWRGPTIGLIHRWPMDGSSVSGTAILDVVGGLNGTASGAGVSSVTGPASGLTARGFDGSSWISLASSPIDFSSAHSVSAWCKVADNSVVSSSGASQTFLNFNTDSSNCVRFVLNEVIPGGFVVAITSQNISYGSMHLDTVISSGTWVHLGYTFSGSDNVTLYANGVPISRVLYSAWPIGSANIIGAKELAAGCITGAMYNVVIYNRQLSDGEVLAVYNAK